MRRRAFLLGMAGAGCGRGSGPRLNVYNWSSYVAPDTIPGFERETGARVRYGIYESNEEMLAKIWTGNSGWDVVFPSNYLIRPLREQRLLAPLDHRLLPNLNNLEPRFRQPPWDPALQWCVPYMWGTSGIVYDARTGPEVSAWAGLWTGRFARKMTMLDDPAELLGACLKKSGHSLNSTDPAQLEQARGEALRQKPLLRAYLNAEARDQLVAGDLEAAQLWATTAVQAIGAAPHLRYVLPAEGFALYCDNAVILKESRRPELAHRFLDYLLRAEVAAGVVDATKTATANGAAHARLTPALRDDPVLYPAPGVLARGEWFEPLPAAAQRLRDRLWTEIKAG
jgi:spermidine/putrescine transport system substrate-binding protein